MKKFFETALHWSITLIVCLFLYKEIIEHGHWGWVVAIIVYFQVQFRIEKLEKSQNETNSMVKELWQELRREQDKRSY